MKAKGHIAGLTAACIMLTTLFGGAASADSVIVTTGRLNMRKEASADSKSVSVVEKDDALSFVSENGEWYQVRDGGTDGYVMKEYVKLDITQIEADVEANTELFDREMTGKATARVNMRSLPLTEAEVVKVVAKNGSVGVLGACGDWYLIRYGGKTGCILKEYVTLNGGSSSDSAGEIEYATPQSGTTTTRVNMRKSASTDSTVVKVLSGKQSVSILGEAGEWYRVSAGGKTGYVLKTYIAAGEEIYTYDVTGRTTTDVNLREEANTSCNSLGILDRGTEVKVIGKVSSWYCVTVDGKKGYVSSEYITLVSDSVLPDAEPEPGDDVVEEGLVSYPAARTGATNERVNLREAASASATVKKILNKNTSVIVLGELSTFYQVKYGDMIGYIVKEYVTLGASGSSEDTSGEIESDDTADTLYASVSAASTTVTVNMRREPEGDILHTLSAGTQVTLIGERGVWYKVIYGNSTGYIAMQYVTKNAVVPEQPEDDDASSEVAGKGTKAYITAASVNMRRGAGTGYGVVKVLTKGEEIMYYSLTDGWYLIKAGEDTGYVSSKYVSETAPDTAPENPGTNASSGKVQQADWWTSGIQKIFKVGTIATVTDVDTGISWQVKRSGGSNHADVQPLTAADTAKMKQAYGGAWSWNRRAIWVTIDGVRYAASMNGMPHGSGSITTNNFDGHHCIHFLNSRTHTGNRWDTAHQSMVQKAYKAGQ